MKRLFKRIGGLFQRLYRWYMSLDHRHLLCWFALLCCIYASIFAFGNARVRFAESCRDIATSVVYYFQSLFGTQVTATPTVDGFSQVSVDLPFSLPNTWVEFKTSWGNYWQLWATWDNFVAYMDWFAKTLLVICEIVLCCLPVVLVGVIISLLFGGKVNNDYNKDSRLLRSWKKICQRVYAPVKYYVLSLVNFVVANGYYWRIFLAVWLFNFNVVTIAVEFVAFYLYFVASFNFLAIYTQIVKLLADLTVAINTIPLVLWLVIALVVLNAIRRKIGYNRLNRYERRNRGFINERPILMLVCGTMGKKKTTMITDMALSQEIMFRDKAFELLLNTDLKFPYFPWINLENVLKLAIERHTVYNLATCRKFVQHIRACFENCQGDSACVKSCRRHLQKLYGYNFGDLLFGYDYERYGYTYNDDLQVIDIWKALEDYTQLYFIYVIESSLITANYSVRTDNVKEDLGNLPLWNTELFKRDSRLMDAYSRHAHILDFDMLRLGRKVVENNEYANAFEFGVVLVTEIGKERGNTLELKEKKKNDDETNQKNDLFNSWLKMCRHSATVCNFPFIKIISDEQRPSSWGADAVDLCEIVYIKESGEQRLAMPLFALGSLVFDWEVSAFRNKYTDYRYRRGDNTLPMYLFKGLSAKINDYKTRIYNTFGYNKMQLQIESGTRDGILVDRQYYLMFKKIYSRRFATDCYSDFYMQKALQSLVGLEDLPEYASVKATVAEFLRQNSYFMADLLLGLLRQQKTA